MSNKKALKTTDLYTYNDTTKQYVFHTEHLFGTNYVLNSTKVDTILKLYSNYNNVQYTSSEIAQRTSTPKKVIEFVIKALDKTHSSIPFTNEQIKTIPEDKLVDDLLLEKQSSIEQKLERKQWEQTAKDAENWKLFEYNYGQVIDSFIKNWNPKPHVPTNTFYRAFTGHSTAAKELIVGLSDTHYGLIANGRYLYNQKDWNIDETKKAVKLYAQKLKKHLQEPSVAYSRLNLVFLGDHLHGLDGFTDKGTKLEAHPIAEEQLEQAFESVLNFIQTLLEVHGDIRVFACPGNHSQFGDYFLVKMLSIYFKDDSRITFEVTSKRFLSFKVGCNYFLMEHGYASIAKDRLPAPGKARETYLLKNLYAKPELMQGTKRNYFLSADLHHSESYEYNNVEGFMFPTIVGGCRYADNSGYNSRPRQLCLVVDEEEGVMQQQYYYFD